MFGLDHLTVVLQMPYFVIPDTSELMVRMLVIMGLVTRKITGRQTVQVIEDIAMSSIIDDKKD